MTGEFPRMMNNNAPPVKRHQCPIIKFAALIDGRAHKGNYHFED